MIAALLLAAVVCDPGATEVKKARAVVEAIVEADNNKDLARVMSLYTADAVLMPPGEGPVQGRDKIRPRYQSLFAQFDPAIEGHVAEVCVEGDLAYVRGANGGALKPKDGGAPRAIDDAYLAVLRREANAWRISRLMWHPAGTKDLEIGDRIHVREDMTVFTLFAMLNAAGYKFENGKSMHPVREKIRGELQKSLDPALRVKITAYYNAHTDSADTWAYAVAAKATSGPPSFAPPPDWKEIRSAANLASLDDLHVLLAEFYEKAQVPKLYEGVKADYAAYAKDYEAAIRKEVAAVLAYCRIAIVGTVTIPGELGDAVVIPNLLDSYERAFSFELGGRLISVEGPQPRIGYNPHEFVHGVTNPAVYSDATRARAAELAPVATAASQALSDPALASPAAYVDEELVRAVSLRYLSKDRPGNLPALTEAMMREYRDGHILERYFFEQLAGFEASSLDLRAYYPVLLSKLDPKAELARWAEQRSGAR